LQWLAHVIGLWTCIVDSKKQALRGLRGLRTPLMTCDSGLCTNNNKSIKRRMKTPIHINIEENEIIVWYSFNI
jgi:hypothetical protein